jgi:hypothetical protein
MSSRVNGHSHSSHRKQTPPPSNVSSHTLIRTTLETTKKVALVGCALLITGGIVYLCACNRNEESWCVLKSNEQMLSNMGLVSGFLH